jgi:outer membrane protein assembly factor BamD (BamD/ComL family)
MVPRKRIKKKQLKQDKFIQTTFEFTDWVRENQRMVTFAVLGAILVVVLGYAYSGYQRKKEEGAQTALYKSMQAYREGNYALSAADLENILTEHSGSPIEDRILYYLASSYYNLRDYDKAEQVLNRFSDDYGDGSTVSHEAIVTLACVHEEKGDLEKAADSYIQAASLSRFPYQEKSNRMNAARLLKDTGKFQEAIEQYDALIEGQSSDKVSPAELDEVRMLRAEVIALVSAGDSQ